MTRAGIPRPVLKRLKRHPLVGGATEVIVDAVQYVATMLVVIVLLGQAAGLAL
jgi:hypothetical protein